MPDSKITALTSISTSTDPANDPLVIVDVSDTSMAATGTTKKVTLNNLLACSPTATLASATITGAASAAGLSVTGSTIPTNGVYLPSANNLGFAYNSTLGMTLNSTGLGVGVSPSYKLDVNGNFASTVASGAALRAIRSGGGDRCLIVPLAAGSGFTIQSQNAAEGDFTPIIFSGSTTTFNYRTGVGTLAAGMTLDASGRLLVGSATPFTDLTGSKEVKIGDGGIQTFSSAIAAATPTNIARGGVGGLVYVGGFNGTGQYGAVVLWTSASATVVSVINNTGSTITFGVSAGFLQITSSLALTTVGANCIRL